MILVKFLALRKATIDKSRLEKESESDGAFQKGDGTSMSKGMNRREFLKASAVTGALILAGDLLQGDPIVYGAVHIPEAEKITITIVTDNYHETTRPSYKIANRYTGGYLYAEHGLSCHIEPVVHGQARSLLFDFGPTFPGVSKNIEALKIEFDKLEALALSHGHMDHWGGLVELLQSRREKITKGIPFYVGEETFSERFGKRPEGVRKGPHLQKEDIESLGFVRVVEIKDPTPIVSGAYLTGRIERVTDYEKGLPSALIKRGDHLVQDNFMGEQAVVLNLKGKGLVVISGCAHVGIVNTVKHAQKITGIQKIHAIMGGFHLTRAKEELVRRTIADIKTMAPEYIMPMHCTGFETIAAFAKEMPNQFILNTAGTKYIFTA